MDWPETPKTGVQMELHPSFFCTLIAALLFPLAAARAGDTSPWPGWMTTLDKAVDLPDRMTPDEQAVCTQRILNELNVKLKGFNFTQDDMAPILMASWTTPRMGLLRGGGYNIRVVRSGLTAKQLKHIKAGRYVTITGILTDGISPSLHIPGLTLGAELLIKTDDSVDFTAHIDSAYAYFPLGALAHLFIDLIGHSTRDPCPQPKP